MIEEGELVLTIKFDEFKENLEEKKWIKNQKENTT
jgi:hypothetical protein